jgi:hypothetical protein
LNVLAAITGKDYGEEALSVPSRFVLELILAQSPA